MCVYCRWRHLGGNIAETVPQSHCFACIFQEPSAKNGAKGDTSVKKKKVGSVYGDERHRQDDVL